MAVLLSLTCFLTLNKYNGSVEVRVLVLGVEKGFVVSGPDPPVTCAQSAPYIMLAITLSVPDSAASCTCCLYFMLVLTSPFSILGQTVEVFQVSALSWSF